MLRLPRLTSPQIKVLNNICSDNVRTIVELLKLDLKDNGKYLVGPCPIHNGDNPAAFNIYTDGYSIKGNWVCRTHQCEKNHVPTIIGFVRAVTGMSFWETIDWLMKELEIDPVTLKQEEDSVARREFVSTVHTMNRRKTETTLITPEIVKKKLKIPSTYYPSLPNDLLIKYDVGYCDDCDKLMSNRTVFPVYDDEHEFMVGCVGRTHSIGEKWINSGFKAENYLYNYWFAKNYIKESKVAILVEGATDVLRLEQYGIHNALGCFGAHLTDSQQIILERSGAMSIISMYDPDDAGDIARQQLDRLKRYFKISHIILSHDPFDTDKEEILCKLSVFPGKSKPEKILQQTL